jgi:hypothetical protein
MPWKHFLEESIEGYYLMGCVDLNRAYAVPVTVLRDNLAALYTTPPDQDPSLVDTFSHWHVKLIEPRSGEFALDLPKTGMWLSVEPFSLPLD